MAAKSDPKYISGAGAKRAIKASKNGATKAEIDDVIENKDVTAEAFFADPKQKERKEEIKLPELVIETLVIRIIGDTGLLCNKWSEKAIAKIRDKQQGNATQGREPKNPEEEFRNSLYILDQEREIYGFPAIAFKKAAVEACTSLKGDITKVAARQAFHVTGPNGSQFAVIEGKPVMQEDAVTVNIDKADLRYRGLFMPWATTLFIRFNRRVLTPSQIINLFNYAGFAVGVGEWRSERDGLNGAFHVETTPEA